MLKLDERDLQILAVLQKEGRISKTDLAARIHLSVSPCWERLKRLEDHGIIEGYGAQISMKAFGSLTSIFMLAELNRHQAEDFRQFEAAVVQLPEVVECWALGGGFDYLLKFICPSIESYQQLVEGLLSREIGLSRYYTYVVTKPIKLAPSPPMSCLTALLHQDSSES